jgi:hypothetical protein
VGRKSRNVANGRDGGEAGPEHREGRKGAAPLPLEHRRLAHLEQVPGPTAGGERRSLAVDQPCDPPGGGSRSRRAPSGVGDLVGVGRAGEGCNVHDLASASTFGLDVNALTFTNAVTPHGPPATLPP